jgi:hypothetical protein
MDVIFAKIIDWSGRIDEFPLFLVPQFWPGCWKKAGDVLLGL